MDNKRTQNILITTLGYENHLNRAEIYSKTDEQGNTKFCVGISPAEAGTKYILSKYNIDKLIILGSEDFEAKKNLSSIDLPENMESENLSEFDFFCYRIAQYLHNTDIETVDFVLGKTYRDLELKLNKLQKLLLSQRKNLLLDLSRSEEKTNTFVNFCKKERLSYEEIAKLKYAMFSASDKFYEMRSLETNTNLSLSYIPVKKDGAGHLESKTVLKIKDELDDKVNVFMDLQGMNSTDGFILINLLGILRKLNTDIILKEVIRSNITDNTITAKIKDESDSYSVDLALSGARAFIDHGKVNQVESYVKQNNISCDNINKLLIAMKYVDIGVSLNNISYINYGINSIKLIINNTNEEALDSQEIMIFKIMKYAITADYGNMLISDEIEPYDLISWALDKQFYQQALTMIESWIPEDMVKKGIYYYAQNEDDIKALLEKMNLIYWNTLPKDRWTYNDLDHYLIKFFGRSEINYRQPKDKVAQDFAKFKVAQIDGFSKEFSKAYSNLNDDNMLYELLYSYYTIGNLRNQVSHALANDMPQQNLETLKDITIGDELKTELERFLKLYKAACEKTKANGKVNSIVLTPDRLRAYTSTHRLMPITDDVDLTLENTYNCQFQGNDVLINIKMLKPRDDEEGC